MVSLRQRLGLFIAGLVLIAGNGAPAFASWTTDGNALGPRLINEAQSRTAPDGAGGAFVVWLEARDCDHSNIWAQHLNAAGTPLWGMDGAPVCTFVEAQVIPHITSDGAGGALIFWQDERTGTHSNFFGQHLNSAGVALWAPDGIQISTPDGFLLRTYIHASIPDGGGGAYVVFQGMPVPFSDGDVYIQHVKATGTLVLSPGGLLLSQGTGHGFEPALTSDGVGGAFVAWTDSRSGNNDIYAQHVTSGGALTWAPGGVPVCTALGDQIRQQLASDGAGGIIVAWQDSRIPTPDIYAQRLNAGGVRLWAPIDGIDLSPVPSAQLMPQVVSDFAGGAIVAWSDTRPSPDNGIYGQRVNGAGVPLWPGVGGLPIGAVPGAFQDIQRIAEDGAGGAIVTWTDKRSDPNGDLYAQRVSGAGALVWAPATGVPVATLPDAQDVADVAMDGSGGALVCWSDSRGGPPGPYDNGIAIYAQRLNSTGNALWMPQGVDVADPGALQNQPSIVADGFGGSITAWTDFRNGCGSDIYLQHLDPAGTARNGFDGVPVCRADGSQQGPQICSDGAGGSIVAWLDFRNGNADIYAQRVDAGGNGLWLADGVPVCADPSPQSTPAIVACQSGGAIIVWDDKRSGLGDETYAQRILGDGTVAPGWPVNGMSAVTGVASLSQIDPHVATDLADGCVISWQDRRSTVDSDVYAQRIDAAGTRRWAVTGVLVCGAPLDQARPRIINDGGNGAIVTWEDNRSGNPDVYARRVDATGTAIWALDGVLIYGADPFTQSKPTIAPDGFGGAIIAWQDDRSGVFDIFAQRVNGAGTRLWSVGGAMVCVQPGKQQDPVIAADGAAGGIIAWRDARTGQDDIYIQRIDNMGVSHCAPGGVALCAAISQQFEPVVAPDGVGGGVAAWTDNRSTHAGDEKVYAMRLPPECGSLTTGVEDEGAPAAANRLHQNQPNPFNPSTDIAYEMAKAGRVRIAIYDISGRLIRTLVDSEQTAGPHHVRWEGTLDSGAHAASAAYFYRIVFPSGAVSTRKMILLK